MIHVLSVTLEADVGDPSTGESFLVKENCCAVVPYGAAPPLGDLCMAVEAGLYPVTAGEFATGSACLGLEALEDIPAWPLASLSGGLFGVSDIAKTMS